MKTDDYIQSLIEKDIPYKPDNTFRDTYKYYGTVCGYVFWGKCKCGEAVWELSKYCDVCGQKLDWSGVNNEI